MPPNEQLTQPPHPPLFDKNPEDEQSRPGLFERLSDALKQDGFDPTNREHIFDWVSKKIHDA